MGENRRYEKFLSQRALRRKQDAIMDTYGVLDDFDDPVNMTEGAPNPEMFPFENILVHLKQGAVLDINPGPLKEIFQYGESQGQETLIEKTKHLLDKYHGEISWNDRDIIFTMGAQDGLCRTFDMLLNDGDVFLTQEPLYCSIKTIVAPYAPKMAGIRCDDHGIIPEALLKAIQDVERLAKPPSIKCLYVNPVGSNPQGINYSKERKKIIYDIACRYDFLIVEDDPYYFLQFKQGQEGYGESFLQLDKENRVLRFDSFSKIICSGIRLGLITGSSALIRRLEFHIQGSICSVPGVTQKMVNDLLALWGDEGFSKHICTLQSFYRKRRDEMLECAQEFLTGICEWSIPQGGMFMWIKIKGIEDSYNLVMEVAAKRGVLFLPGKFFMVDDTKPCPYIRVSFSSNRRDKVAKAFGILREVILEWKKIST